MCKTCIERWKEHRCTMCGAQLSKERFSDTCDGCTPKLKEAVLKSQIKSALKGGKLPF